MPDGRPRIVIDGQQFTLAARGRHQPETRCSHWALVRDITSTQGQQRGHWRRSVYPVGRGELSKHGGLTLLNDGYNAIPIVHHGHSAGA